MRGNYTGKGFPLGKGVHYALGKGIHYALGKGFPLYTHIMNQLPNVPM